VLDVSIATGYPWPVQPKRRCVVSKRFHVVLVFTLVAFVASASLACANEVIANIQFPYNAGGKVFAAGRYEISTDSELNLVLRNLDSGAAAFLLHSARINQKAPVQGEIVLQKNGDHYSLFRVFMPGIDGFQLETSPEKPAHSKSPSGK